MWTESNHSNLYPSSTFVIQNYVMDRYVEDASYLRCADITLNYILPKTWMSKIGFRMLRFMLPLRTHLLSPTIVATTLM